MSKESRTRLVDVRIMLAEAARLNDNGQHGAALKHAYHASEYLAAAYILEITGQSLLPNHAAFELFYKIIQEPERHPGLLPRIEDVVGDLYVLREAYEPALLDETVQQDASQMISCVADSVNLVESVATHHK